MDEKASPRHVASASASFLHRMRCAGSVSSSSWSIHWTEPGGGGAELASVGSSRASQALTPLAASIFFAALGLILTLHDTPLTPMSRFGKKTSIMSSSGIASCFSQALAAAITLGEIFRHCPGPHFSSKTCNRTTADSSRADSGIGCAVYVFHLRGSVLRPTCAM